jgi:hypothetical protein
MATNTVKPEAKYTVEDLFTAYIAYDRRQKPLGGPGHETPEASWKTVQLRMPENWLRARSYGDGYGRRLYTLTLITALNRSVNKLRETLGDSADNPRFIETLPGRGYRFKGASETFPRDQTCPSPK